MMHEIHDLTHRSHEDDEQEALYPKKKPSRLSLSELNGCMMDCFHLQAMASILRKSATQENRIVWAKTANSINRS